MDAVTITMSADKVEDFEKLMNELFETKQITLRTVGVYDRTDKCRVYELSGVGKDFWLLGVYWGIKLAHKMQGEIQYSIGDQNG